MTHTPMLALFAAATLIVGACRPEPGAAPPPATPGESAGPAGDARPADPDSLRDHFVQRGLAPIGETRAEIRARLGRPESTTAEAVPNRHDPARTDSIFTLHYADLTVVIHQAGGRDLLSSVTVEDDRYLREPTIRIGMPWDEVRRRLGEPQEVWDEGYVYHCRSCVVPRPIVVAVEEGLVRSIRFTYYVD